MKNKFSVRILILLLVVWPFGLAAQQNDTLRGDRLDAVKVRAHRSSGITRLSGPQNGTLIGQDELFRAACCNLGESFVANASVDVNYSDAATGARQIKLLGLSGQYVQMLAENLPMGSGAATPYLLGYVPGAWMKSISVSKGASSVRNGFQSVTGQINIEYLKPEDEPGLIVNLYGDRHLKAEGNVMGNIHLGEHLSGELLAHYEHDFAHHADENEDGWIDVPAIRQFNLQNRWKYAHGRYIFHGGVGLLEEQRVGGTSELAAVPQPVRIDTRRYEAYMKHAILLNREHNTNMALLANASRGELEGHFFHGDYSNEHDALNATLMVEHDFNSDHNLSAGVSLLAERVDDRLTGDSTLAAIPLAEVRRSVPGAFAQYTFTPSHRFTLMAGMRADYLGGESGRAIFTPRLHLKWALSDHLTLRASSGKGYRIPYALAEYHYLLASWRQLSVDQNLPVEEAWNSGVAAALTIPVGGRFLKVNAEYYYTHFLAQTIVDFDSDPSRTWITALDGRSFSHTAQVDATFAPREDLEITAAYRLNDVRCTYGGVLREKPLTSRYKALLTAAWKPMMELWQVDATICLNGPGRLPAQVGAAESEFSAYPTLNMQLTRRFRHWSLYVGGENLTHYRQAAPVLEASTPTAPLYDPSLLYGPIRGAMLYAGVRLNFWKL